VGFAGARPAACLRLWQAKCPREQTTRYAAQAPGQIGSHGASLRLVYEEPIGTSRSMLNKTKKCTNRALCVSSATSRRAAREEERNEIPRRIGISRCSAD
jgi:hypothetical protein